MPRLSIHLFGSFEVTLDDVPVTGFVSDKVRALLAYLVVNSEVSYRRETLAGLLWPDYPETSARTSLRNALANLRQVIGDQQASPAFLHISRQAIQFNRESDHWLDVSAFTTLITPDEPTTEALEEAVALYKGVFLGGFSVADSIAFEEWLILNRESYHRQVLEALHHIIEISTQSSEYDHGLPYARRLVEMEPWDEEGQRGLMYLLALSGRRGEALVQYEKCRQALQDELGVVPSAETQTVYNAIHSGEIGPVPESQLIFTDDGDSPFQIPPTPPIRNIPTPPTPLIGREAELAALEELLADHDVRMVTIVGPGGMGKTRLSLEAGMRASGDGRGLFNYGVAFVELAPLSAADQIIPAIAEALRLRLEKGEGQLFDYLRHKQLLLILDNFEHLPDGVNLLTKILHNAPDVKLLVTSRERLQLHHEHSFPIEGLAYPHQDPASAMEVSAFLDTYAAAKLFIQSARRVQSQLVIKSADLIALSQLCRMVEGLPLALELAAAWVDTIPLADILSEIQINLDFLQTEWRDIPRRQHSIRAVFDSSWKRLSLEEQKIFPQLSVFRGGFTRDAANQVAVGESGTTETLKLLSNLVRKSFLRFDLSTNRYQIHELLRQYGAAKLSKAQGQEAGVQERHSRYYCKWLSQTEDDLKSPRRVSILREIKAEAKNVHTACLWAAVHQRARWVDGAVNALGESFFGTGPSQTGQIMFTRLADELAGSKDISLSDELIAKRALVRIYIHLNHFYGLMGDLEQTRQLADKSQAILDVLERGNLDTKPERAHLLLRLGYNKFRSNAEEGLVSFTQSRDIYQEIGDHWGLANAITGIGQAQRNMCLYQEAQDSFAHSLELRQEIGDEVGIAGSLILLGQLAHYQGYLEEAIRDIRRGLTMVPEINRRLIAYGLNHLGYALAGGGRFSSAETRIIEGIAILKELGDKGEVNIHLLGLAWIYLHQGKVSDSRTQARIVLTQERKGTYKWRIASAQAILGCVNLIDKRYLRAAEKFKESIAVHHRGEFTALVGLGLAERGLGHNSDAWKYLISALHRAIEFKLFQLLMFTFSGIALMLADQGEVGKALELFALASSQPYVANSRWFEDIAGKHIAAAAAGLPKEVAEAARARGVEMDLWETASELLEELERPTS